MLVGGIKVVGIYVWVSETAFKNSTLILCQVGKYCPLAQFLLYLVDHLLVELLNMDMGLI